VSNLPSSWVVAPLGDLLTEVLGGGTPDKSKAENFRGDIPFMTVKDMHSRFIDDTQDHISQEALASSASRVIPADTLVIASRMSLGKIARPTRAVAINQDLKALFLHQGVSKPYIEYAWRANAARIRAMGTGTTVKGIRLEDIRNLEVPVAPAAEQTRIADQLDTLLARIQACQDRLEAIPALLKRFRQSVLTAAVSGDLTSEWRDAEGRNDSLPAFVEGNLADATQTGSALSVPSSWRIVQARNVVQPDAGIVYGIVQPGPKLASGIPYVQTTDIVDGRIQLQSLCHTSEEIANGYRRSSIRRGDVLLGIIRALKVAVVPEDLEGANISRSVARLRPREGVLPKFLAYALQSPVVQEWLRSQHRGMDMPVLNLSEVRLAPIPIAPIGEQAEIVGRVDSLFALAAAIQTRYTAALGQIERMAPVLLTKAFRGELCPQDPNDEPASALLARVAAERNAPAPTRRPRSSRAGRPPRAPKDTASMTKSRQDDDVMDQPYLAGHLRRIGSPASAESLFKVAELPWPTSTSNWPGRLPGAT
jgi:type I restriction enzyme, S subunit